MARICVNARHFLMNIQEGKYSRLAIVMSICSYVGKNEILIFERDIRPQNGISTT